MTDNLKTFYITISYYTPDAGTAYISAPTKEAALDTAKEMFADFHGLKIVDVQEREATQLELELREERDDLRAQLQAVDSLNNVFGSGFNYTKGDLN